MVVFLAYVDSSGRPNFEDKENYVVASMITNEASWQSIDNSIKQIKLKHFPGLPDSEIEIHAKDMVNRHGLFQKLSFDQIYSVFDDVFEYISSESSQISIIAVVIDKTKLAKDKDIETWAYRLLLECVNKHLERENHELILAQYPQQFGIMIFDTEDPVKDQKLRRKLYGMLRQGTMYNMLNFLIEDPLFTDSKWRNLSQLVDCIAYCVRKRYRSNTPSLHTEHWETYFNKIEKKLDSPFGSYFGYGLKIFP